MHSDGIDIAFGMITVLLLVAGLWAILSLRRKRRRAALDSLDNSTSRAPSPDEIPRADGALRLGRDALRHGEPTDPPAGARQVTPASKPQAPQKVPKGAPDLLLRSGLAASRASLWGRMSQILGGAPKLDGAILEALEEVLLLSDVGVSMTMRLIDALQAEAKNRDLTPEAVRDLLRGQLLDVLQQAGTARDLCADAVDHKPRVVLFVGVNGVGKTTTIGKVAHALTQANKQVVLAAGDTFRAAAAEQLQIWGVRTGARVVRGAERADPASVMFNAMQAAQSQGADVLLADTAGRLHTNLELMEEIKKVRRALGRLRADAPDEVWLVVDATTGQNALHQAKQFHEAVQLTGIILTKLDGTAKGGIVIAIADALKIPVCYVGTGEQADALRPFDATAFVDALL